MGYISEQSAGAPVLYRFINAYNVSDSTEWDEEEGQSQAAYAFCHFGLSKEVSRSPAKIAHVLGGHVIQLSPSVASIDVSLSQRRLPLGRLM